MRTVVFDVLSIDIEGNDLAALQTLDFERFQPFCVQAPCDPFLERLCCSVDGWLSSNGSWYVKRARAMCFKDTPEARVYRQVWVANHQHCLWLRAQDMTER